MSDVLTRMSRIAPGPAVLSAIADADCNLAIWQRPSFADFAPLLESDPQDLRFVSDEAAVRGAVLAGLRSGGFGGPPALHNVLAEDIAALARLYCAAMDLARFELRLEVVRTDSCRKFHADYVTARLITTYAGEGTDWLDEADALRVAAGMPPERINRLAAFDVGLFKGRLATDRPAIHRSPPIADTGAVRLLLVLNPVSRPFVDSAQSPLPPQSDLA